MKQKVWILLIFLLFGGWEAHAQESSKRNYTTQRVGDKIPQIDGNLDDACWQTARWEGDFIQHEPFEGKQPSQQTSFAICYDDEYLYVAIKAFDTSIDSIEKRMTRRDEIDGEEIGVQFDSYHDLRTAFVFNVSAGGVKEEYLMSNDGETRDKSWDPIWWVKTEINSKGWFAEMKIPLTQLRFVQAEKQIWGLQVTRRLFRKSEYSIWQPIPRENSGWVHNIGELSGLNNINPQKILDITPYFISSAEAYRAEEGNPYATGRDYNLNGGVDGKIGLTNNFTLDFTLNPDFGQVEADPSEVNLTAYESFFDEKRPFFIEGRNILSFPVMFGDGDMASENLFYTRRIGRRPHYYPELADGEYADVPGFTSILAAAKITGKTADGWSIGVLESVGAEEVAEIDNQGTLREETVEPMTNYFVARVQKDMNEGNSIVGGLLTSTNRKIETEYLNFMHTDAYSGGLDFTQYFKEKNYVLKMNAMFSNVQGDSISMIETQLSSRRYYQRPDNDYVEIDSSLRSFSGYSSNIQFGKVGGKLNFIAALIFKSPSFEINDLGFLPRTDEISEIIWVGYNIYEPFSIFRYLRVSMAQWSGWDFGGTNMHNGTNLNVNTQFTNYWNLAFGANLESENVSNGLLRGGPSMKTPGSSNAWFWLGTNDQHKFRFSINGSIAKGMDDNYLRRSFNFGLTYRPLNTLKITLYPDYGVTQQSLQYVSEQTYNDDSRYIFATLDQTIMGVSLRINYNITPDLSIEYWGRPFIAAGAYSDYKVITNPLASNLADRYQELSTDQIQYDADNLLYFVDENKDGTSDYVLDYPDFNFKEFLSNLVVRWEYVPGSTVYLVWSQSRSHYLADGAFNVGSDMNDLFYSFPHSIFMLKFSYRIAL